MTRIYAAVCLAALLLGGCSWFEKHPVIPAVVTCTGETIPPALVAQVYNDVVTDNWFDLATNVVPLLKDGYADIQCIWGYLKTSNPETVPHIKAMQAKHAAEFQGSVSFRSLMDCPAGSVYGSSGGQLGCFDQGLRWLGPIVPGKQIPIRDGLAADLMSPFAVTVPTKEARARQWDGHQWFRVRGGALIHWSAFENDWDIVHYQATAPGGQQTPVGMGSLDRAPEKAGNGNAAQTAPVAGESGRLDSRERPVPVTLASCDAKCGGKNTSLATSDGCRCWHVAKNWRDSSWVAAR